MPTLNSFSFHQIPGQAFVQPFPPGLAVNGPIIQVQIEVPTALAAVLQQSKQTIPSPIDGLALIDTGATRTSIDAKIFADLGINPVGIANVGTAGGPRQQSVFPARCTFPGTSLRSFELPQVIGCDLTGQAVVDGKPLLALIGRDILSEGVFVYNGSAGMFSLSF